MNSKMSKIDLYIFEIKGNRLFGIDFKIPRHLGSTPYSYAKPVYSKNGFTNSCEILLRKY